MRQAGPQGARGQPWSVPGGQKSEGRIHMGWEYGGSSPARPLLRTGPGRRSDSFHICSASPFPGGWALTTGRTDQSGDFQGDYWAPGDFQVPGLEQAEDREHGPLSFVPMRNSLK